jgi:hypothetical protein
MTMQTVTRELLASMRDEELFEFADKLDSYLRSVDALLDCEALRRDFLCVDDILARIIKWKKQDIPAEVPELEPLLRKAWKQLPADLINTNRT